VISIFIGIIFYRMDVNITSQDYYTKEKSFFRTVNTILKSATTS